MVRFTSSLTSPRVDTLQAEIARALEPFQDELLAHANGTESTVELTNEEFAQRMRTRRGR